MLVRAAAAAGRSALGISLNIDRDTATSAACALAHYRQAGYLLLREEVAETESNKTIGGGIRRYYFAKTL
jgi:hypothetical protein